MACFIRNVAFLSFLMFATPLVRATEERPNIVYFLCDDLGIGELGCYGQTKIKTPNIDRLAARGMLFTRHYSGSTVCAPSRCSLLTGLHTGHGVVRGNREIKSEGQLPIPDETFTLAEALKTRGYVTACVGKWGLGRVGSSGDPLKQGFDHFYGYNCQRHAHSYYPSYLWRDDQRETLNDGVAISGHGSLPAGADPMNPASYAQFIGRDWSPDFMIADATNWVNTVARGTRPFFLYYATPLPHVAIQVPDERVARYRGKLGDDAPYRGEKGYLPTRSPRAGYAAMIDAIDESLGQLMDTLEAAGVADNTIIFFCSDNGPTFNGGTQSAFFKSARGARGLKCDLYEGGIRVPMIAAWPGKIKPGTTSDVLSSMIDMFPTFCAIAGAKTPEGLDGINLLPTLMNTPKKQKQHAYLYWENTEHGACQQALRVGDWKLIRFLPADRVELYNLDNDPKEKNNCAKTHADILDRLRAQLDTVRTDSTFFPLPHR